MRDQAYGRQGIAAAAAAAAAPAAAKHCGCVIWGAKGCLLKTQGILTLGTQWGCPEEGAGLEARSKQVEKEMVVCLCGHSFSHWE
eukprot:985660-Pelagomonas_calceolata.AAC.2